jgi:HD-GYP domain-containing protein (c-di-GMP phosphodiesterase class II)
LASKRSPAGEEGISPKAGQYRNLAAAQGAVETGPLLAISTPEIIPAISEGLDLAEGRQMGHAKRMCYIAMSLARALGLPEKGQLHLYYAALLHDVGVPAASADLSQLIGLNEDSLFAGSPRKLPEELAAECPSIELESIVAAFHRHCVLGGESALSLGFRRDVAEAVSSSHEHWDGSGYPEGLAAKDIPLLGRILGLADWAESIISEQSSSLIARRNVTWELSAVSEVVLDPRLVGCFSDICRNDQFWLGLYSDDLPRSLLIMKPGENGKLRRGVNVLQLTEGVAAVIDSKSPYTKGKSVRVARVAEQLAEAIGLSPERVLLIRVAALLHDIGQLGIPARILGKPEILTLTEMQLMQKHPSYSRLILEELPGLEDAALWVGAHHERPDGKGYPEMLAADLIPLESKIIAVANVYVALTSERPYRPALSQREALKIMKGAAGTQLDSNLVRVLSSLV